SDSRSLYLFFSVCRERGGCKLLTELQADSGAECGGVSRQGVKSSGRLNVILRSPCQRGPSVIAGASVREPVQGEEVLLCHPVNSAWPFSSLLSVGL
ncbi:hypothetical protein L3Q82_026361, partial [Scortum barcoo]